MYDKKVCLISFVSILFLVGCSVDLRRGLTEDEAQEIVVILKKHAISAKKELVKDAQKESWKITVGSGSVADALNVLQGYDLPRERQKGFAEIFGREGLIPTATEEKAKFLQALSGEIARTLETLDGIVGARVHVAMPEENPLRAENQPAPQTTASVLIKYRSDNKDKTPILEDEVKKLVAHSVQGLNPNNVAVAMKWIGREKVAEIHEPKLPNTAMAAFSILVLFLAASLIYMGLKVSSQRRTIWALRQETRAAGTKLTGQSRLPAEGIAAK